MLILVGKQISALHDACKSFPDRLFGLICSVLPAARKAVLGLIAVGLLGSVCAAQPVDSSPPRSPVSPTETETPAPVGSVGKVGDIPDFHLTEVQIDATVGSDRINFVARLEIVVNRGTGWHRVPLRLGQAHVWRRDYNGPGEEAPDLYTRAQDDGINWMIKGTGRHQLTLHAWTPLRRTVSGGQFQLSLPQLPPQFETRLKVQIPEPNAAVRSGKGVTILGVQRKDGHTDVEASVVGNRLDFAWQTPTNGAETVSLVVSRMQLRPSAEHLSLIVEQTIELQQTTVDHLLIRLPSDFRLVRLLGSQYRSHEPVPDRPNWIRVNVVQDSVGRITLRWDFERLLTEPSGSLVLDGFEVAGAMREEGIIRVDEFENARMIPRLDASEMVHRISVNQVRDWSSGVPLTAYEYLKQPFRLAFDIQPISAYVSIDPDYALNVREDELELTVRCPLRIDQGTPTELRLNWPGWEQQGWRLISSSSTPNLTGIIAGDVTSEPDVIRLSWGNPIGQDVTVQAVFRRPTPHTLMEAVTFTLPEPKASRLGSAQLTLQAADALEVQLVGGDSSPLAELLTRGTDRAADAAESTAEFASTVPRYRVTPGEAIKAQIVVHPREIVASTTVQIHEATHSDLTVEQAIQLQVKYGRLSSLDLVLPPALAALIQPYAVPESLDVWLGSERLPLISSGGVLRANLPTPMKGTFEVRISYRYPIDTALETQSIDLPILNLETIRFVRAQCLIEPLETVQVRAGSTGWEAVRTSPRGALWIKPLLSEPLASIPLEIGEQLADSSQQYVVDWMHVRTLYNPEGAADNWAEFQLESPPNRLVIQFPRNSEFKEYLVDGMRLDSATVSRRSQDSDELTLILPSNAGPHPRVAIRYRTPGDGAFGLTRQATVQFPQFPRSVWVDETVWELQLPYGHHLFTDPKLVPQFQWVRHFLTWRREPTPAYLQERIQTAGAGVPSELQFQPGDFYAFRGFGPVPVVTFRSMNRSLILLIGAGFTLLLGYLFWKLPVTRNVLSLICIAFLFAAASLWYLEPILLLLQPAAVGLFLALTATVLDGTRRRSIDNDRSQSRMNAPRLPNAMDDDVVSPSGTTRVYRPVGAGRSDSSGG